MLATGDLELLKRQRARLEAAIWRHQHAAYHLKRLIEGEDDLMAEPQTLDTDHRALGVALFNDSWRLLEKERTPEEDDQLLHQAHASTFHWLKARECEIAEANPESMEDFDLPFAYEALARAQAVAGDRERSESYEREARAAAERIADPEDREVVLGDLATIRRGAPSRVLLRLGRDQSEFGLRFGAFLTRS